VQMVRITAKLPEDGSPSVEFRQCTACGMMIDHASDHRPGCRCRKTVMVRRAAEGAPPTNADWCQIQVNGLVSVGIEARVGGVGSGWVWVERRAVGTTESGRECPC